MPTVNQVDPQAFHHTCELPGDSSVEVIVYANKEMSCDTAGLNIHQCTEIGYCYEGDGVGLVKNHIYPFCPGDAILIPPACPHIAKYPPELSCRWVCVMFDAEKLFAGFVCDQAEKSKILSIARADIPYLLHGSERLQLSNLARMIVEMASDKSPDTLHVLRHLIWAFLLKISDAFSSVSGQKDAGFSYQFQNKCPLIYPAINHICCKYHEPISVGKLADLCNLSTNYFRRLFFRYIGCNPTDYLCSVRIHMAAAFLKSSSLPVSNISRRVGFQSVSSFNRHFKKQFGMSPLCFRKHSQQ